MSKQKILYKKLEQLNELKGNLVFRSDENKQVIVEKIRNTVDELTMILEDFEYIKDISFSDEYRGEKFTRN